MTILSGALTTGAENGSGSAGTAMRKSVRVPTLHSRLRHLLESDLREDVLVLSDTLVVSRPHYAERLGLSYGFVSAKASPVFKEFDEQVYLGLVRRTRDALERALELRVLPLRDGKVERKWLRQQLGVSASLLLARKELRAVVEGFDAKVHEDGYLPASTASLLEKLNRILENDCPLAVGRKRIALREVARLVGCEYSLLKQEPFLSAMRKKRSALESGESLREGDVLVAGKVMEFSSFMASWPKDFVLRLGQAFQTFTLRYEERAKEFRAEVVSFLRWLENSTHSGCEASRRALLGGGFPDAGPWRSTLDEYEAYVTSRRLGRSTDALKNRLGKLNKILVSFAAAGLFPLPHRPLKIRDESSHRHSTPRRSIAEVSQPPKGRADALVAFAATTLFNSKTRFPSDYQDDGAKEFLACLRQEFISKSTALADDTPKAVLDVIKERLASIAEACKSIIGEAQARLEEGDALLSIANVPANFPGLLAAAASTGARKKAELLRKYFPRPTNGTPSNLARANLLALAKKHFGGKLPESNEHSLSKQLGRSFFLKLYLEQGGRRALQNLLTVPQEARAAVATLYMVESGANVAVALGLKGKRMRPSLVRGFTEVVGSKLKAGGKPIYVDLPTASPCITAMQWLWKQDAPLRKAASGEGRHLLFVSNGGSKFRVAWFRGWFESLLESIPKLAGLRITPSMLRPSVLLKAALEHDGNVAFGQAVAQHGFSLAASKSYQGKSPTRMLWDQQISRFQVAFESRVILSANEVVMPAGQSAAEIEARVSALEPTGLGTFCRNRSGRPGLEGQTCKSLDCLGNLKDEDCCPQMEVVLYPGSAALMQVWKTTLEKAEPDWERDRPDRWQALWLPWLAFLTVVAEKASRGPLLRVWKDGAKLRRAAEVKPGFVAPCPF